METLDLHGVRHYEADRLVENFVVMSQLPVRIITGNSPAMKEIVHDVLGMYGLIAEPETHWNLGSLIVRERQ